MARSTKIPGKTHRFQLYMGIRAQYSVRQVVEDPNRTKRSDPMKNAHKPFLVGIVLATSALYAVLAMLS